MGDDLLKQLLKQIQFLESSMPVLGKRRVVRNLPIEAQPGESAPRQTRSIVDFKIADRLSLSRRPKQTFDFDTFILTEQASIPDLQFGPIEVTNVLMAITKLKYLSTRIC
jgi:hypothetical protein